MAKNLRQTSLNAKDSELHSRHYHLTFDIDWAPDFAVAQILELLAFHKKKATFFVTHQSDILKDICAQGHNLGIHPNFLPNSDQGSSEESIIGNLLNIVPDATMMRTHALIQSSPMFYRIFKQFPQLKVDLSLFMDDFPLVQRFTWNYDDVSFERINYNWEDDMMFSKPNVDWQVCNLTHLLTILDFHPIHIALNSSSFDGYRSLIASLGQKRLVGCCQDELAKFRSHVPGAFDYLSSLLSSDFTSLDISDIP